MHKIDAKAQLSNACEVLVVSGEPSLQLPHLGDFHPKHTLRHCKDRKIPEHFIEIHLNICKFYKSRHHPSPYEGDKEEAKDFFLGN